MPAKIVHITSVHSADDVRIFHKECQTLSQAGFDVTLIAPDKSRTGCGSVAARSAGASARPQEHLSPTSVPWKSIGSFSSRWRRISVGMWRILRAALAERADLYHLHDPELIPLGIFLRLLGRRVVYDVHEDLPEQILSKHWIPRPLRKIVSLGARLGEWFASRVFNGNVTATRTIARRFPAGNTAAVRNFPLLEEFSTFMESPRKHPDGGIVYMGGISEDRGLDTLLDALLQLPGSSADRLTLAGAFCPPCFEAVLRAHPAWERVDFKGWCDRPTIARMLSQARVGVIVLEPLPRYQVSLPVKLFEYMAAGLPVVVSDFPLWREIVTQADCGLLVDPRNPRAIAQAIRWLLEHPKEAEAMGRRGRAAVLEHYNWDIEAQTLLNFYRKVLHENSDDHRRPAAVRESCDCESDFAKAA